MKIAQMLQSIVIINKEMLTTSITYPELTVMVQIALKPKLPRSEYEDLVGLKRKNLDYIVVKLESQGFIKQEPMNAEYAAIHRVKRGPLPQILSLTPEGEKAIVSIVTTCYKQQNILPTK